MILLKNEVKCSIFGPGRNLPNNVLPTYENVMELFILIQYDSGMKQYEDIVHNASQKLATEIEEIGHKNSMLIVKHSTI